MSVPLICVAEINTFGRARCNCKQRLSPGCLECRGKVAEAVGSTQRGVRPERSEGADAWFDRAGSRPHNTKASLSLKLLWAQGAKDITRKRVKALATNALDAVGPPQTHLTPPGAATQTHKQKGSLGE